MFSCISCTKPSVEDGGDDEPQNRGTGTSNGKEPIKSFSNQIKNMALRASKANKDCSSDSEGNSYPFIGTSGIKDHRHAESTSAQPHGTGSKDDEGITDKEWMAQVEPGVHITFVTLPSGGNDLKRIRFSREMFNKWQAQRWWGENYERIMELYNVQRFNRQALHQSPRSEEEHRDSVYSRVGSSMESPIAPVYTPRSHYRPSYIGGNNQHRSSEAAREDERSFSNASEMESSEWVEEDEPGVFITIRQLADGTRELRRVRFSRERFGEVNAKEWWEMNRERIEMQYLG